VSVDADHEETRPSRGRTCEFLTFRCYQSRLNHSAKRHPIPGRGISRWNFIYRPSLSQRQNSSSNGASNEPRIRRRVETARKGRTATLSSWALLLLLVLFVVLCALSFIRLAFRPTQARDGFTLSPRPGRARASIHCFDYGCPVSAFSWMFIGM
jgi:hypothetical protein